MAKHQGHYYYFQTREDCTDPWKVEFAESKQDLANKAEHISVFGLNAPVGELRDEDLKYYGDWVLDIDSDLEESIAALQRCAAFFAGKQVPLECLRWFATGGKGFHIIVPLSLLPFRDGTLQLPLQLKQVTRLLGSLVGAQFDTSLYNRGKGHPLRVENKKRSNGRYKVPLLPSEIEDLTPEKYLELTARPRIVSPDVASAAPSSYLSSWLVSAIEFEAENAAGAADEIEARERLKEMEPGFIPRCIEALAGGQTDLYVGGREHNYREMQLAAFLTVADLDAVETKKLVNSFVLNNTSQTYNTEEKRAAHFQGVLKSAQTAGSLKFSCAAMLSTVQRSVCQGCPIRDKQLAESDKEAIGVKEEADGYFLSDKQGNRGKRLTTFVMRAVTVLESDTDEVGTLDLINTDIMIDGEPVYRTRLSPEAFVTDQSFRKALSRCQYASIWATTDETTRIRHHFMTKSVKEADRIHGFPSLGLHHNGCHTGAQGQEVDQWVYVEPNWSVNSVGVSNTHRLLLPDGSVDSYASHRTRRFDPTDSINPAACEALQVLLQSNDAHVVGRILGWVAATHIKEHLAQNLRGQFPLLNLYGLSGSGKTQTAVLHTALASSDFTNGVFTAEAATPAPYRLLASQSNTVPRILDEANKSKMGAAKFAMVRGVLKAVFGSESIQVGTLARGPRSQSQKHGVAVASLRATSPIIYMATQPPEDGELTQRNLEVAMSADAHRFGRADKFRSLYQNPNTFTLFWDVARQLIHSAMMTPRNFVWNMYQSNYAALPDMPGADRPKLGMAMSLTGLDFLVMSMNRFHADARTITMLTQIKEQTFGWLSDAMPELTVQVSKTELDFLLEHLNTLASMGEGSGSYTMRSLALVSGVHYMVRGETLYLNTTPVFASYLGYMKQLGKDPEYQSPRQMELMLSSQSDYFLGRQVPPNGSRVPWIALSIPAIEGRAVDLGGFKGS